MLDTQDLDGRRSLVYYNPIIETMSRGQLLDLQWKRLNILMNRAYEKSGFYRNRFDAIGVRPDEIKSLEDFRTKIPFLTKKDLLEDQDANPPYGARSMINSSDVRLMYMTSGTTGVGQEIYGQTFGDLVTSGSKFMELPIYLAGLRRGDTIYSMTPVSTLAYGLMVTETARQAGWNFIQAFMLDSKTKIRTMLRLPPNGIIASSIHMVRLTQVCQELGIDPRRDVPTLKAIVVAGQSYPMEIADRIEQFWGVKLYETYGSSQGLGHMAGTCEHGCIHQGQRGKMHIFEHNCLLEVIDPETGNHVGDGETGVGVITNLDVAGTPLIRFFTNDKMRYFAPDSCDCGYSSASIEAGTISRYDDMMKIRGMNIWPQTVDNVIFGFEKVSEYLGKVEIAEDGNEVVYLKIAFRPELESSVSEDEKADFIKTVRLKLKETCNVLMNVEIVPRAELPIFEFKAIRWEDKRQQGLQKKIW